MEKGKYAEGRIFDLEHLPAGYVAMGPYNENKRHHNALCKACASGSIRRIRYCRSAEDSVGHMYVFEADVNEVIRLSDIRHKEQPRKRHGESKQSVVSGDSRPDFRHLESAIEAMCEISNGIAVLCDEVRRLRTDMAAAVELLAKQPKTAQQELVSTFESNGFHQ